MKLPLRHFSFPVPFYLLALAWGLDYVRRRWNYRQVFRQTRALFKQVTRARVVERELEDAEPLEILLQARAPVDRWYYLERYERALHALVPIECRCDDWLIDVGCGDGFFLAQVVRRTEWNPRRLVAVEVSLRNLELAGQRLGPSAPRVVAEAERLPFKSGCARALVCTEVLEHTLDPERASAELARVCEASGTLALSTPSRHALYISFLNPCTWLEAWLGLWLPVLLPPFHNLERPRDSLSVIHRAFTVQELKKMFGHFSTVQLTTYHFRLPTPALSILNLAQVQRLERLLARWPMLNRLGLTLILVAQK